MFRIRDESPADINAKKVINDRASERPLTVRQSFHGDHDIPRKGREAYIWPGAGAILRLYSRW